MYSKMSNKSLFLKSIIIVISSILLISCNSKPKILKSEQKEIHGRTFEFTEYEDDYKGVSLNGEDILYGKYESIVYKEFSEELPGLFVARSIEGTFDVANEQGLHPDGGRYLSVKVQGAYAVESSADKFDTSMVILRDSAGSYKVAQVKDLKPLFETGYKNIEIKSNSFINDSDGYSSLSYMELTDASGKKAVSSIDASVVSPFIDFDSSQVKSTQSPYSNNENKVHKPYISVSKDGLCGVIEMDGSVAVPVSYVKIDPDLNGYKDGPVNFYWIAEAPDGTVALYYKGEVIIPSGTYDGVGVVYGNEGQDRFPWISCHISTDDGWAKAVYSMDGKEIIPPLKDCSIKHLEGKFMIFNYDDHREEHGDGYTWDELYDLYLEPYSKAKHRKYEMKGIKSSGSTVNSVPKFSNSDGAGYESYQEWVPCYECNGSGKCRYCNGDGWDFVTNSSGEIISSQRCCVCMGNRTCQACSGNRGHYEMRIRQR